MKSFRIFDDITPDAAKSFASFLGEIQAGDSIQIELLSYGGEVFSGIAMAQLIDEARRRGVESTAVIYGLAASAAAILALSCDRVVMAASGVLMLHGAWREDGEEDEGIAKANEACLSIIRRRCPAYAIEQLLDGDNWYSAEEAQAIGLADEIMDLGSNDSALAALSAASHVLRARARLGGKMKNEMKNETDELVVESTGEEKEAIEEITEEPDLKTLIVDGLNAVLAKLEAIEDKLAVKEAAAEVDDTGDSGDIMSAKMRALYDRIGQVSKPCARPTKGEHELKADAAAAVERVKKVFPNISKYYE